MCDSHLALAQAPSDLTRKSARLKWLEAQLPDIAASGTDLVLLPELFACGYGIGDQIHSSAEPRGGKTAQGLACLARQFSIATHSGYVERDGDMFYNSASCIGPDGGELVHQRKLAIPPGFERDYFSAGQGCNLFTCKGF